MKMVSAMPASLTLLLLLLLLSPEASKGALTCSDVIKDLRPCLTYLKGTSGMPPATCCTGVSGLASAASSSADKKTACGCIKTASKSVNFNPQLAKDLPSNCKVNLPFTVSSNIDCSKVS